MMNTDPIEVAGLSIEVVHKPIKNLHIGVYPPSGRVRVAAPTAMSHDAIRVAILSRLPWVKAKQAEFLRQSRETERQLVSGETHYLFGRRLRLAITESATRRCAIQSNGSDRLTMIIPQGATSERRSRWLADWYRNELKRRVAPRIEKWADRLVVPAPHWGIRQMRTKWGSCNPELPRIWINLEMAKKPLPCLDYVVLHEMAHLVSPRHDDLFITTLDRHMPNWRQVRSDLNALPLRHDVDFEQGPSKR